MITWLKNLFRRTSAPAPQTRRASDSSVSFAPSAAKKPTAARALCGPKALALILEFEGLDQPHQRPPGESGITLGIGFDLGYCTAAEFLDAWQRHLPDFMLKALLRTIGVKGQAAEALSRTMAKYPRITREDAMEVFERCTLPKWTAATARTYPGLHVLNPDQQGVLVSIVFNRGPSLEGPRRREMKAIREILTRPHSANIKARCIAEQIQNMQRLWPDIPGLQRRRRAEADLMLSGV
jgi:GH24 family phage-related lysozyme (muramidase)